MNPVEFPEQTYVIAKDQPEYLPLPAFVNETETISCWRLSWRDRWRALIGRPLWMRQMNFGQALQPQQPTFERPFVDNKGA